MTKTMKSRSTHKKKYNDSDKLKIIADLATDNITLLLDYFEIDYRQHNNKIIMPCPIHNGDNQDAVNIWLDGSVTKGNWKCRTHHCERIFRTSIIGFIRGLLSHEKLGWETPAHESRVYSFQDTVKFILDFNKQDYTNIEVNKSNLEKKKFVMYTQQFTEEQPVRTDITRDKIRHTLHIPAKYYLERGYSKEILDKYDVGLCSSKGKEMYGRIVAPVYDETYSYMVGCTGRTLYEKCILCKMYHSVKETCPNPNQKYKYMKWRHNHGFSAEQYLYNYWFAKPVISKTGQAILVEGPGDVWRLEEAGVHNSVCMFGAHLTEKQKKILDSSGAIELVVLTDSDSAGILALEQIVEMCKKSYNIRQIKLPKNDVGEMSVDEVHKFIKSKIGT